MSNSNLVSYTKISPNSSNPRNHAIDTITIHCVVGQLSVETIGNVFAPTSRQASSNYGVGADGRIGMYVEEKNRSWCSSSASNDNRAITIEVASDTTHPYTVNNKAYAGLLDLVTDICKRNGIKELKWKADKSLIGQVDKQNMSVHRWFANKSCPGDYLYNLHGQIASEVNKRLNASTPAPTNPKPTNPKPTNPATGYKVGDIVNFSGGPVYSSANAGTAAHTRNASRCKVTQVYNGKHPYHCISEDDKGVYGWVDAANVGATSSPAPKIAVGSTVRITGDKYATGQGIPAWVKKSTHTVSQISGSKALLGANGGICSWVNLADLTLA